MMAETQDTKHTKKLTPLQAHLRLNDAHYMDGRFYYRHSLRDLGRLLRRHGSRITDHATGAVRRIELMVASRTGKALGHCALPKKQQRRLGMLPAV